MAERVLVTGVLGCLGAWVSERILADGDEVIGYDLGTDTARLELVLVDGRGCDACAPATWRWTLVPHDREVDGYPR